jgi:hypothetical protein
MFWFPDNPAGDFSDISGSTSRALVYHTVTGGWTTYSGAEIDTGLGYSIRQRWLNAFYRAWDGATFTIPGPYYNGAPLNLSRYLCKEPVAPPATSTDQSTYSNAGTTPVIAKAQWNATTPNPHGMCRWSEFEFFQQPYLMGPNGQVPANSGSTAVEITSDLNQTTSVSVPYLTGDKGRTYLATASGWGTRQTVKLTLNTNFNALNGFSFLYRPISGRNTK